MRPVTCFSAFTSSGVSTSNTSRRTSRKWIGPAAISFRYPSLVNSACVARPLVPLVRRTQPRRSSREITCDSRDREPLATAASSLS